MISKKYCREVFFHKDTLLRKRHGITLIEVVAGLVMVGSLLTVMIVTAGRFEKNRAKASQKLQAVRLADSLMTDFFASGFPSIGSEGLVPGSSQLHWKLTGQENPNAPTLLADVRLLIHKLDVPQQTLASIEVLINKDALGQRRSPLP
jgi:type II secretory pathway pseudopilin PulG